MKKIYQRSLFLGVLLWLLVASCSQVRVDGELIPYLGDGDGDEMVAVEVSFPQRVLVSEQALRAGTFAAQDYEQALQQSHLFFYVFSDQAGQPDRLLRVEPVRELAAGTPEVGVTGKVFFRNVGTLHVVPTANLKLTAEERDALIGVDFATFSKVMITQLVGEPNWFPMAGEPVKVDTQQLEGATLSFTLERLTARIDLINETSEEQGGRFELTGARLIENNIDRSFLIKNQTPPLICGEQGAVAISTRTWVERDATVNSDPDQMFQQLYTYENEANQLKIEVKGTFEGRPAEFVLNFEPKIVRNTRYLVQIRNVKKTDVPFIDPDDPMSIVPYITVLDWEEGGNVTLTPEVDRSVPVITAVAHQDDLGQVSTYTQQDDLNTLQSIELTKPDAFYTDITLLTEGAEPMILLTKVDAPWIEIEEVEVNVDNKGMRSQKYRLHFGANADLYPRTALLEIQNRYVPNKISPKTIAIKQSAAATSPNPLAYWANANVDELNTFATVVTEENVDKPEVFGKLYQWGRNVPFDYEDTAIQRVTTKSNGNDELLWDRSKFIYTLGAPNSWFSLSDVEVENWNDFVALATNAPAWYKGSNAGDPSPIGYRLPTYHEICAVFPYYDYAKTINFYGENRLVTVNEQCTKHGYDESPKQYSSQYYTPTKNVIYGLKLIDGEGKDITAYRWEYRGLRGLKVTARHLGDKGKNIGVKDISTEAYWRHDAGSDVVRLFPATNMFSYNLDIVPIGRMCYYWSSSLGSQLPSACHMGFGNNTAYFFSSSSVSFACPLRPVRK